MANPYEGFEPAWKTIDRIVEETGVEARAMVGQLLHAVAHSHTNHSSVLNDPSSAENKSYIVDELRMLASFGDFKRWPVSVLEALLFMIEPSFRQSTSAAGTDEREAKRAKQCHAAKRLIQELIKNADRQALQAGLVSSEFHKAKGEDVPFNPNRRSVVDALIEADLEELDGMIPIPDPKILGMTYGEVMMNLEKIAATGRAMIIVPKDKRQED